MNLQSLIEKCKSYPLASGAILGTVLLLVVAYVRGMGQADLEGRYDEATRNWTRIDANIFKNSVNLEEHVEQAQEIAGDVKERLIRPSQLAQNYQYFYRLEASTGVRIVTLQQQQPPPRQPGPPNREQEKAPQPLFSKVGYTMNVTGSFSQVLDFLHALEHGQHFYQVRNFAVQRPNDASGRNVSLVMNFDLLGRP